MKNNNINETTNKQHCDSYFVEHFDRAKAASGSVLQWVGRPAQTQAQADAW